VVVSQEADGYINGDHRNHVGLVLEKEFTIYYCCYFYYVPDNPIHHSSSPTTTDLTVPVGRVRNYKYDPSSPPKKRGWPNFSLLIFFDE